MRFRWSSLGSPAGIGLCLAGVVAVWAGWNGAASYDRVTAQFPYLISGGVLGLGLIVIGAAVIVVQSARSDRAAVEERLAELREAIELLARSGGSAAALDEKPPPGAVIAGPTSFHEPGCRLLEGREGLPVMSRREALAAGLTACRVCIPTPATASATLFSPEPAVPTRPLALPAPATAAKKAPAKKAAASKRAAGAKKAAAKKAPSKRAPAKGAPAKKAAAKKAARRR